ncbi:ATP-binding protein [Bacillus tianshenii]|nr:ATP-binding protein [Bacillus tianshenii]
MYWFIKELSPNLFFMLFLVLLYQFWFERREWSKKIRDLGMFSFAAMAIVLCMSFPVHIGQDFIYDLRSVPLIVGGLYGGTWIAVGLSFVTVICRFFVGGMAGFYTNMIVVIFGLCAVLWMNRRFFTWEPRVRVASIILLVMTMSGLAAVLSELMHPELLVWVNYQHWLGYLLAYFIAAFITCNVVESIIKNEIVRKQSIRNEKLEVVSHLASSISHEVRNPLTASRGFLQLLNEEKLPLKSKKYIHIALEELDRAEGVIRDYLTFAKPTFEESERFQVEEELERAVNVITPLANMSSVIIDTNFTSTTIKGERAKLQQCFINLMKNAIEAMPNGGYLRVESKVEKSNVVICISDTGSGMTKDQINRLGEPYFSTKGIKGTGLGMMVVYRIIESLKGTIEVTSEVEQGTTFVIKLPAQKTKKRLAS